MWIKIRDLTRSVTKKSGDYDEKYMKMKLDSNDQLPLNKTIKVSTMFIVIRAISYENHKYYVQVFFGDWLCEL